MVLKTRTFIGVSPKPLGSPQCDNPKEGINSTITLSWGDHGVTVLPSKKHLSFLFSYEEKRNSMQTTYDTGKGKNRFQILKHFLKNGHPSLYHLAEEK